MLATPLLREGVPIGIIYLQRSEVQPFTDKQIALAKTFEDELRSVIDWLNRYQLWIVVGSLALVVLGNVRNFRRGR